MVIWVWSALAAFALYGAGLKISPKLEWGPPRMESLPTLIFEYMNGSLLKNRKHTYRFCIYGTDNFESRLFIFIVRLTNAEDYPFPLQFQRVLWGYALISCLLFLILSLLGCELD